MSDRSRPEDPRRPTDAEALTAVLAERAREEAGDAGGEPEADELFDFLEGTLPPEAERDLERRLLASPEATRELLDLAEMREAEVAAAEAGEEAPAELAVHAGWRELEGRVAQGDGRIARGGRSWRSAVAAALLLAAVGVGYVAGTLGRSETPALGVSPVVSLELAPRMRSRTEAQVELPRGTRLRLVLAPAEACDSYRVELSGPRGSHAIEGLVRDELGRIELLLDAVPGSYALLLEGCAPARRLDRHEFRVVSPGGGRG